MPRKKKALVDFLCCLPIMLESAASKDSIKLGFTKAGMIIAEDLDCEDVDSSLLCLPTSGDAFQIMSGALEG